MTKKNNMFWAAITFLITFFICLLLIIPAINNRISTDRIRLEHLITDKGIKISEAISIPVNQLYTVASYIERNNGSLNNIEDLAATVVNSEYVRNLIIAPNGIISNVYPEIEEHKQLIGYDYYDKSHEGNTEAIIAAFSKKLLLAGPFTTVVGDKAISGRLPVYLPDEMGNEVFWGILSITLKYPLVMESTNIDTLTEQGYTYELWHNNTDTGKREVIMSNGVIDDNDKYIDKSIQVQNADWNLRISPIPKWYQYTETWTYILLSIVISIMVSFIVLKNRELGIVKKELELLVHYDSLTKVLNREGLFHNFKKIIKLKKKFMIHYIDLNNFKQINDIHGHATGDEVLVEFAQRFNKHINNGLFFSRIGGDEFILVNIIDSSSEQKMADFWDTVYKEFEAPISSVNDEELYISFSRGTASYSPDLDNIDDVISKADRHMYQEKNIQKGIIDK